MTLQTLLEPLEINHMTLKNRIMFPPMTTGYEARDGSITEQSINFYKRVAEGGASYIVLGDVTPVHTISPTPKLVNDDQIPSFKALADALHEFDCKLGLQVFHPEYDTVAVAELFAKGDMAGARAKLHHDMQHYINEVNCTMTCSITSMKSPANAFRRSSATSPHWPAAPRKPAQTPSKCTATVWSAHCARR